MCLSQVNYYEKGLKLLLLLLMLLTLVSYKVIVDYDTTFFRIGIFAIPQRN